MSLRPLSLTRLMILLIVSCCHGDSEATANGGECVRIDAALNYWDTRHIYFFHGDEYLKMDKDGNEIRKASIREFGGLKSNIDAAVFLRGKEDTYFFKGSDYYRLHQPVDGPYATASWNSVFKDGIDAAGTWDGHIFFFKGCKVYRIYYGLWKYLEQTLDSAELGLPCDVDAAFPMGYPLYVIKGDRVWELGGRIENSKPLSDLVKITLWNICPLE